MSDPQFLPAMECLMNSYTFRLDVNKSTRVPGYSIHESSFDENFKSAFNKRINLLYLFQICQN